jgi:hypothetical protein
MDIDEFYDQDDRRRRSTEIELGMDWRDKADVRYELNWVADTGELYVTREAASAQWLDPFGGIHVSTTNDAPNIGMTVAVVAHIATREDLERILSGWEKAMERPDSTAWIEERLQSAGVATWTSDAPD